MRSDARGSQLGGLPLPARLSTCTPSPVTPVPPRGRSGAGQAEDLVPLRERRRALVRDIQAELTFLDEYQQARPWVADPN